MNPFESFDKTFSSDSNLFFSDSSRSSNIVIRTEMMKSKKKTVISGWNIPKDKLKDHLKTIQDRTGSGGSLLLDKDTNTHIIQLQGNRVAFVKDFLIKECEILEEFITIKGVE